MTKYTPKYIADHTDMYMKDMPIKSEDLIEILKLMRKLYDLYIGNGFPLTEKQHERVLDLVSEWLSD